MVSGARSSRTRAYWAGAPSATRAPLNSSAPGAGSKAATEATAATSASSDSGAPRWESLSWASRSGASCTAAGLGRDGPGGEVRADLALDALQRVVDRLRVAPQPLADDLVGVAVEVERQHARLEVREDRRKAGDQRAQLLGRDDLVDRIVRGGAGQHLVERGLPVDRGRGRRRERDVL